jgi:RNA polymerase sigma factor (sigma-70 family)
MKQILSKTTSYGREPDGILWVAFTNGDKDAFATIYYRYFTILIQSGLRVSDDKDLIKDCIHDLFLEMWKNKKNLGIPLSVKAYLASSIHRKLVRQLKKTRSYQSQNDFDIMTAAEVDHSVEKKIIAEQSRLEQENNIYKALSSLPKRQKEAVYLKFYANLSYPEIAGKMAISTDSIYNLVSKAIENMQSELAKISLQRHS